MFAVHHLHNNECCCSLDVRIDRQFGMEDNCKNLAQDQRHAPHSHNNIWWPNRASLTQWTISPKHGTDEHRIVVALNKIIIVCDQSTPKWMARWPILLCVCWKYPSILLELFVSFVVYRFSGCLIMNHLTVCTYLETGSNLLAISVLITYKTSQ